MLHISANPEDVVEIMQYNDICIYELLKHFDVPISLNMRNVLCFIATKPDPHEIEEIIETAVRKMKSDSLWMAGRIKRLESEQ